MASANMLKTGLGRRVSAIVQDFAEAVHDEHAFRNVSVVDCGDFVMTRGTQYDSSRMVYRITKTHVATLRSVLRGLGYSFDADATEALLFHAEGHRGGICSCRGPHFKDVDHTKARELYRQARREYLAEAKRKERQQLCNR